MSLLNNSSGAEYRSKQIQQKKALNLVISDKLYKLIIKGNFSFNYFTNFINLPGKPVKFLYCSKPCLINISVPCTIITPDSLASLNSLVSFGV